MIMDGPATLASAAIGLTIAPHFDNPYITESVSGGWWGGRGCSAAQRALSSGA